MRYQLSTVYQSAIRFYHRWEPDCSPYFNGDNMVSASMLGDRQVKNWPILADSFDRCNHPFDMAINYFQGILQMLGVVTIVNLTLDDDFVDLLCYVYNSISVKSHNSFN
jgi:hypothetical protein